jgi:hypothetical protein
VVSVEAAKMVASPYSQDRAPNERASRVPLLAVVADPSAPDYPRAKAILRLAEMQVIAARMRSKAFPAKIDCSSIDSPASASGFL